MSVVAGDLQIPQHLDNARFRWIPFEQLCQRRRIVNFQQIADIVSHRLPFESLHCREFAKRFHAIRFVSFEVRQIYRFQPRWFLPERPPQRRFHIDLDIHRKTDRFHRRIRCQSDRMTANLPQYARDALAFRMRPGIE